MQPESKRRVHGAECSTQVLAEWQQPGVSVAAIALAHGLNVNLLRKWLIGRGIQPLPPGAGCAESRDAHGCRRRGDVGAIAVVHPGEGRLCVRHRNGHVHCAWAGRAARRRHPCRADSPRDAAVGALAIGPRQEPVLPSCTNWPAWR